LLLSEQDRTRAAAAYVDAQIGFFIHLAVYVFVIVLLFAANYSSGGTWWVQWPALGWGIGILGHAFGVFGTTSRAFTRWRLKRIDDARTRM
jgi:hypothetical protein